MTEQHLKGVAVGISLVPVQQLLEGVVLVAVDDALGAGVVTHAITDDGIVILAVLGVAHIQVGIQGEVEAIRQHEGDIALTVEGVAVGLIHVQFGLPQVVAACVLRTGVSFTAVVDLVAFLVQDVGTVR